MAINRLAEIENAIKAGNIDKAQSMLDDITDRNAEWHYLQSAIFYKKNWVSESKNQLEIAMEMEPYNKKYAEAYTKLKQKIEYTEKKFYSNETSNNQRQQMGESGTNDCLSFCLNLLCLNIMCNSCCR